MNKVVLVSDQYNNCPICGSECRQDDVRGYDTPIRSAERCQIFVCINPLASNPFHYYTHIVEKSRPTNVAYIEFTLNMGNRYIIFALDLLHQKTYIKNSKQDKGLELQFALSPDFPHLHGLIKKIRTAITFS